MPFRLGFRIQNEAAFFEVCVCYFGVALTSALVETAS